MARLSREHMHDEIQAWYNLSLGEYLEARQHPTWQLAVEAAADGQEATTDWPHSATKRKLSGSQRLLRLGTCRMTSAHKRNNQRRGTVGLR